MQSFERVGKTSVCLISARLIPKDRWKEWKWRFQGFNTGKKMAALLINSVDTNRYSRPAVHRSRTPRETRGSSNPNAKESNVYIYEKEREREKEIGSSFLIGRDDLIDRCLCTLWMRPSFRFVPSISFCLSSSLVSVPFETTHLIPCEEVQFCCFKFGAILPTGSRCAETDRVSSSGDAKDRCNLERNLEREKNIQVLGMNKSVQELSIS